MYKINNNGPRTVPWGIPDSTSFTLENSPSKQTRNVLRDRKLQIIFKTFPFMRFSAQQIYYKIYTPPDYKR